MNIFENLERQLPALCRYLPAQYSTLTHNKPPLPSSRSHQQEGLKTLLRCHIALTFITVATARCPSAPMSPMAGQVRKRSTNLNPVSHHFIFNQRGRSQLNACRPGETSKATVLGCRTFFNNQVNACASFRILCLLTLSLERSISPI